MDELNEQRLETIQKAKQSPDVAFLKGTLLHLDMIDYQLDQCRRWIHLIESDFTDSVFDTDDEDDGGGYAGHISGYGGR